MNVPANAVFRPIVARENTPGLAWHATVADISERSLVLRVPPTADVSPDQPVDIGSGDAWERGRIAWSHPGVRDTLIVSVEFTEPATEVVATLFGPHEPASVAS
ncbi:MAG: hypothetical protein JO291_12725 [Acidimicrobiia bacterium]|nr:hypothetical protein [Acidimicrobiia bacterium]